MVTLTILAGAALLAIVLGGIFCLWVQDVKFESYKEGWNAASQAEAKRETGDLVPSGSK